MEFITLLLDVLIGIVGFGVSALVVILKLILALIGGIVVGVKLRSILAFAIAAGFLFFFPWAIIFTPFVPKRQPKLDKYLRNHPDFKGKDPVISSIMALSAIVAKADGQITKEEVNLIKATVSYEFNLSAEAMNEYEGAFVYGRDNPDTYPMFTKTLSVCSQSRISQVIFMLIRLSIKDDNTIKPECINILKNISFNLGVSEAHFIFLVNYATGGPSSYGQQTESPELLIKKYSQVLGVSEDASMNEIKKAYRKLVKEYHPDKFADGSMPDSYVEMAKSKIIEINEAYEYLQKVKDKA
ncbi:MAG: hypothetical protein ATN33_01155 [Epulopiscium sp. Nele67-Bin001]|nr:MAG: hypothetical protein BEN18_05370 [Epulopiscium sp. Nuni2H_MBin001]OON91444.1 MAG: hypothetical protein ATN33_01155 [Epulopiscium sp. Nele67-Bin001]